MRDLVPAPVPLRSCSTVRFRSRAAVAAFILVVTAAGAGAADAGAPGGGGESGYFGEWFERSDRTKEEQPRWVTPLVTVTPRLEQEIRYDQIWQTSPAGKTVTSYGGGKGLELIPFDPVEVIIGFPAWQTFNHPAGQDGWADENVLLKLRLVSANKENGDYIVTAFLGFTIPSGSAHVSSGHVVTTPTIAAGKGWGDFDVQTTLGVSIPDYGAASWGNGTPILWNTALQYRVAKYVWPEFEFNYTYWPDGLREGRSQLYVTGGVLFGRVPLGSRVGLTFGGGYQMAVSSKPNNDHAFILTARLPF